MNVHKEKRLARRSDRNSSRHPEGYREEYRDLDAMQKLLPQIRDLTDLQLKTCYQSLCRDQRKIFAGWLGNYFLSWLASSIEKKTFDQDFPLLSSDIAVLKKLLQESEGCSEGEWRQIYDSLWRKRKTLFVSGLGEAFLKKLRLDLQKAAEAALPPPLPEEYYKKAEQTEKKKQQKAERAAAKANRTKQAPPRRAAAEPMPLYARVCTFLLLIVAAGSLSIWGYTRFESMERDRELSAARAEALQDDTERPGRDAAEAATTNTSKKKIARKTAKPKMIPKYKKLRQQYPQLFGWIQSDGLDLDEPVMQPVNDPDFYLTHDFNGNGATEGALFVDYQEARYPRSNYIVIYGHNMKSGKMFGKLDYYNIDGYLEQHRKIRFDTLYEKGNYEAVALVRTHVLRKGDDGFRYYQCFGYRSKEEWQEILSFVNGSLVQGSTDTLKYGDQLLLMSTCEYSQENGRYVLVCRKAG